jgi:peptide/nickel transport system substrate-binding protein
VNSKQRSKTEPKDYENNPIGTGPFKLVEWKKGERIVLERYDKYWNGVPKIKKITIFPITDQNTRISALKSGTLDVATDISPALAKDLKSSPSIEVISVPSVRIEFVYMRTDEPPFNDKRVRQALNYAINKDEFVKELISGFGLPLGQPCPPYFFGHNPGIKPYPYDPEKARQLLKEAGYPKGLDLFYEIPALFQENARAIAGYLQAVDIKCKLEVKEFAAAYADILERKMRPLTHFGWGNWSLLDIDGTLQFVFGCTKPGQGKWSYYCNPRIEEIIAESKTIDENRRLALAQEASQILYEEAPVIFLYAQHDIHAKRPGLPEFKARTDNTINLKWVKGK